MTFDRRIPTRLIWIVLLSAGSASCASDSGETSERSYANDVLVDSDWIEANMDDSSVRLLEVGGNSEAFAEGHLPGASFLSLARLSNPDDPVRQHRHRAAAGNAQRLRPPAARR